MIYFALMLWSFTLGFCLAMTLVQYGVYMPILK